MKKTPTTILQFITVAVLLGGLPAIHAANYYTSGHGDIGIGYEDEGDGMEFHLHGHLGSAAIVNGSPVGGEDGEEFEPDGFITVVPLSQKYAGTLPSSYAPTGSSGDLWTLGQTQVDGAPFLGLATEDLDASDWVGDITFTLDSVVSPSGSGNFSLWSSGAFGDPEFFFSTFDPASTVNGNNTLSVAPGLHAHYNFGFTEPGTWALTFTVSGTHVTDGFLSDTGTFYFTVVPEPGFTSLAVASGLGLLVFVRRKTRRA